MPSEMVYQLRVMLSWLLSSCANVHYINSCTLDVSWSGSFPPKLLFFFDIFFLGGGGKGFYWQNVSLLALCQNCQSCQYCKNKTVKLVDSWWKQSTIQFMHSIPPVHCAFGKVLSCLHLHTSKLPLRRQKPPGWGYVGNCPQRTDTTILQEVDLILNVFYMYYMLPPFNNLGRVEHNIWLWMSTKARNQLPRWCLWSASDLQLELY